MPLALTLGKGAASSFHEARRPSRKLQEPSCSGHGFGGDQGDMCGEPDKDRCYSSPQRSCDTPSETVTRRSADSRYRRGPPQPRRMLWPTNGWRVAAVASRTAGWLLQTAHRPCRSSQRQLLGQIRTRPVGLRWSRKPSQSCGGCGHRCRLRAVEVQLEVSARARLGRRAGVTERHFCLNRRSTFYRRPTPRNSRRIQPLGKRMLTWTSLGVSRPRRRGLRWHKPCVVP